MTEEFIHQWKAITGAIAKVAKEELGEVSYASLGDNKILCVSEKTNTSWLAQAKDGEITILSRAKIPDNTK